MTLAGPTALEIRAVRGIGEVTAGADLAALLLERLEEPLRAGDVLVVTSKVVSKAAGLVVDAARADLLAGETDRVVARRGPTQIVRTRHGLTMAAAGVDASNTPAGTAVPLPPDPDGDARDLRARVAALAGVRVAVVISDTAGRAWRTGQTDIAVGAAGLVPESPMTGSTDSFGNTLEVTSPAVADEVAAAADLVKGKLSGCPVAVVRGLPSAWLSTEDGPGAAALVRPESGDLFGLGSLDAVRAAVRREDDPVRGFPAPAPDAVQSLLRDALHGMEGSGVRAHVTDGPTVEVMRPEDTPDAWMAAGAMLERLRTLATAYGLDLGFRVR